MSNNAKTYLGRPCPICQHPMFRRSDGKEVCLSKWRHRTIADIMAEIEALATHHRQAQADHAQPSESQQTDAAYWLDNPRLLVLQAQRERLARLYTELEFRQAGGPPIPYVGYTPLPFRGMSSAKSVTARPQAQAASKPSTRPDQARPGRLKQY